MQKEIPKTYTAKDWEEKLSARWKESGFFNPDTCIEKGVTDENADPFSIVLPPPNVTGTLHVGHAAMLAIQDTFARYHRMQGDKTLWLPGTDHAAIATQSKVEQILYDTEKKTRHDLGREEFLRRVEQFAKESHDTIVHQIEKMGSSVDWSREAYTLDEARSLAVRTAFKRMYDAGIIYRGDRIVNWDPKLQTTVSDDEVEHHVKNDKLYYLKYGPFEIATARPETKFGDKYVVMHPEDERYKEYKHGQTIELEWINGPVTATIIKDDVIDQDFGTGVMTITPWHDMTDFDIAERHHLDKEQIIDENGKLLPIAGEFAGLDILDARPKIVEKLKSKGLLAKTEENYTHSVAVNTRGMAMIEPQIKKQWFVAVNKEFKRGKKNVTLKSLMQDAVRSKKISILPERFEKIYFHWIDNLRDWCISRQLWYGHRIPVWYRGTEVYCGIEPPKGEGWEQDPDTLDTWFSSGLWTFSTLGWPKETKDLKTYHPISLMETGYDIIFFWVARMILMSEYLLEDIPFKTVYLHGLVRDENGQKMSKSLGNILDPLDVIEKYGADALRLALMAGTTPGNDLRISDEKITASRNFVNKLWNIGRYALSQTTGEPKELSAADHWILSRLDITIDQFKKHIEKYNFSLALNLLRDFTWNEFADWYVEIHKVEKNDAVLRQVFEALLKLWHPFAPFVTEALYSHIQSDKLLMVERLPHSEDIQYVKADADTFEAVIQVIDQIRRVRAAYRVEPKQILVLSLKGEETLGTNVAIIKRLARVKIEDASEHTDAKGNVRILSPALPGFLRLEGVDVEKERTRLIKEKETAEKHRASIEKRLSDKRFTAKAPEYIIAQSENLLTEIKTKIEALESYLQNLVS